MTWSSPIAQGMKTQGEKRHKMYESHLDHTKAPIGHQKSQCRSQGILGSPFSHKERRNLSSATFTQAAGAGALHKEPARG